MNSRRRILGIGMLVVVLIFATVTAPAMAREDDCTFYLNTSDGSHEIIVAAGEEATVYLDVYAPVNKTGSFSVGVLYDPEVVEFMSAAENASVTDWMDWRSCGYKLTGVDPQLRYAKLEAINFYGVGPGDLRCADMTLKGNGSGITTIYLTTYPDDVQECLNRTRVCDLIGDYKDWTLSEPFTVICGSPETFTKSLALGWNLISLPLTPLDDSTSAVLGNATFVYDKVYSYDASTNQFVDVTDGTMEIGVGYFVDVTTEGTWSYDGYGMMPPDVGDLEQGLNCIGWTNTSATLPDALGNMGNYCDWWYVARLNATSQKYELYDADAPEGVPEFIDFDTMERGEGYFIVTKNPYCTFAYP